jgi:hypothetical protein
LGAVGPTFLSCRFLRDDESVESETVAYETGARALTLMTTSAELGLQLYSAYLGDEELEEAIVAEVAESARDEPARLRTRRITVPGGFLLYHRDRALADHLERFVGLARECEIELRPDNHAAAVPSPLA